MKRAFPVIVYLFVFSLQAHAQVIWQKLNLPEAKISGIQASPNGKLFLMTPKNLYASTDEGDSWTIAGTPADFQIDSSGNFIFVNQRKLFRSTDEGKSWEHDTLLFNVQYFFPTKDSLYFFSPHFQNGMTAFSSGDLGRTYNSLGPFNDGNAEQSWSGGYISPRGYIFGTQLAGFLFIINRSTQTPRVSLQSGCWSDNSPATDFTFDYSGFGYANFVCNIIRTSDDGLSWISIDSVKSTSGRYLPPYLSLLNNHLLVVTDSMTVVSQDHTDTWQKIGEGIKGQHSAFVDRKGFVFMGNDNLLYRMSLYASVHPSSSNFEDIKIYLDPSLNQITLQSSSPLGSTTASLYSIDGRLLKHEKINIAVPGNYEFDISGFHSQFGFLVLQTAKGVITRKIIF
jgi:hypothetical protein